MKYEVDNTTIIVRKDDLTEQDTDAIVNAANSHLQHGGGVAGAIVRKGGDIIQQESDRVGFVPVGSAAITTGGNLKAKFVIHAVGPRQGEGQEEEKLRNATLNTLRLADEEGMRSISFPAISTGIFGFPMDRCADIMLKAVHGYCSGKTNLREIRFCLFDDAALQVFLKSAGSIMKK